MVRFCRLSVKVDDCRGVLKGGGVAEVVDVEGEAIVGLVVARYDLVAVCAKLKIKYFLFSFGLNVYFSLICEAMNAKQKNPYKVKL